MSYSKKIYIRAIIFLIFTSIILLSGIVLSAYYSLHDATKYGMIVIFLLGFFYYPLNKKITDWIDSMTWPTINQKIKDIKSGKRGFEGENVVASWLMEIFGKENILRNVVLPGDNFDNDIVIVCSKGVITLEVKNYSNPVHFEGDEYFYEKDGKRIQLSPDDDPRLELGRHAYALRRCLNDNGFKDVTIKKALVFSNGKASWNGDTGVYVIKDKESLRNYIEGLDIDSVCTLQVCDKIKILLKK